MNVDLINSLIKNFFMILFSNIITFKLLNIKEYNANRIIQFVVFSIITSVLYVTIKFYSNTVLALVILFVIISMLIRKIISSNTAILAMTILLSFVICFLAYGISATINFFLMKIFKFDNNYIKVLSITILQFLLIYSFFKIKKYKNGFYFLQNNKNNEYIDIIIINISIIIIFVYTLFGNYDGDDLTKNIYSTLMALGVSMIITIQKTLTMYYKQKLLDNTMKEYEMELAEKDKKIQALSDEKFKISKLNHEFYNRQKALELKLKEALLNANTEMAEELDISSRIEDLSKEYSEALQKVKSIPKLPKTDIPEIDDMFTYMQHECIENNIDFKLQINGNIYHMINKLIQKNKLETLIGDHIKDAIIAINFGINKNKRILAILGIKGDYYEFCIYDTGIEFKIDTLLNLGLRQVTTHKETGGSGIGFVTTFETMKESKASLIIEEKHKESETDYTKSVTIRFDGKNEYRIRSYRAEEIKKHTTDNRIIIEKI